MRKAKSLRMCDVIFWGATDARGYIVAHASSLWFLEEGTDLQTGHECLQMKHGCMRWKSLAPSTDSVSENLVWSRISHCEERSDDAISNDVCLMIIFRRGAEAAENGSE